LKKFLRYFIAVVLSLAFFYVAFQGINFNDLLDSLKNANYFWLLLFVLTSITSHFFRAWRWRYMLDHLKKDISLRNLFSSVMIGYMFNNFIPRGGELARPYALGKLENISVTSSLATVLVERVLDVLTLVVLVVIMLLMYHDRLISVFPWLNIATFIAIIISVCGIGAFIFMTIAKKKSLEIIRKCMFFLPQKISKKILSLFESFIEGLNVINNPQKYIYIVFFTITIWFLYSLQQFLPFYSFNMVNDYSLNIGSAILLNTITAIGVMIPVPGSTGTYHAFCIQALTGLFFVPQATSAAYATSTHAVGLIGISLTGLYFFLKDNIKISGITKKDQNIN
jgi:glycosyltransferase 2 family protein